MNARAPVETYGDWKVLRQYRIGEALESESGVGKEPNKRNMRC